MNQTATFLIRAGTPHMAYKGHFIFEVAIQHGERFKGEYRLELVNPRGQEANIQTDQVNGMFDSAALAWNAARDTAVQHLDRLFPSGQFGYEITLEAIPSSEQPMTYFGRYEVFDGKISGGVAIAQGLTENPVPVADAAISEAGELANEWLTAHRFTPPQMPPTSSS